MTDQFYERGKTRGAYGFPWRKHRTLAEIDAGLTTIEAMAKRAGKIKGAKWRETTGYADGDDAA